jgi:putative hydrolase of the HAD superfamily
MLETNPSGSIRAVFIDFGGVLYHTPHPTWLPALLRLGRRLRPELNPENPILLMMITSALESEVVMDLMTGKTDEKSAWDALEKSWRIPTHWFQHLRRRAFSRRRLDWELLEYIHLLRPQLKTALLTNAGTEFRPTFVKEYQLEQYFDQVLISAEEGCAKPDPRLYHKACVELDVRPAEAVFFDDQPPNITGARSIGMQAYVYQSMEQVRKIIEQQKG